MCRFPSLIPHLRPSFHCQAAPCRLPVCRAGIARRNKSHGFKFPLPIAAALVIYGRRCLPYIFNRVNTWPNLLITGFGSNIGLYPSFPPMPRAVPVMCRFPSLIPHLRPSFHCQAAPCRLPVCRAGIARRNKSHGFKFQLPIAAALVIYGRRCLPYIFNRVNTWSNLLITGFGSNIGLYPSFPPMPRAVPVMCRFPSLIPHLRPSFHCQAAPCRLPVCRAGIARRNKSHGFKFQLPIAAALVIYGRRCLPYIFNRVNTWPNLLITGFGSNIGLYPSFPPMPRAVPVMCRFPSLIPHLRPSFHCQAAPCRLPVCRAGIARRNKSHGFKFQLPIAAGLLIYGRQCLPYIFNRVNPWPNLLITGFDSNIGLYPSFPPMPRAVPVMCRFPSLIPHLRPSFHCQAAPCRLPVCRAGIARRNKSHGFKFPLPIAAALVIYGRRCLPYIFNRVNTWPNLLITGFGSNIGLYPSFPPMPRAVPVMCRFPSLIPHLRPSFHCQAAPCRLPVCRAGIARRNKSHGFKFQLPIAAGLLIYGRQCLPYIFNRVNTWPNLLITGFGSNIGLYPSFPPMPRAVPVMCRFPSLIPHLRSSLPCQSAPCRLPTNSLA